MASKNQQDNEQTKSQKPKLPWIKDVDGFLLPGAFSTDAFRSALAYKARPDDLFIVSYPKCGTTWLQHIVFGICRDGKIFESGLEFITQSPFLETGADAAEMMKRPGPIKTHQPFNTIPWSPKAKYIFVARNPKDCCVSYYHHTVNLPVYYYEDGKFDDYFELFMNGEVDFGDYFDTVLSWYHHRNDPNVLFITYEELQKDIKNCVFKIAEFLGPQYKEKLENDEQLLNNIIHHSSFNFMKEHLNKNLTDLENINKDLIINNPDIPPSVKKFLSGNFSMTKKGESTSTFVRKGIVGDWKNHFSASQNARMMEKFRERTAGTDLPKFWEDCM